ncbi:MAG: AraC family transcriptional regulator [Deltaproteobacteria bacterium]
MLEVIDSRRPWRCFSSAFELMLPDSWQGSIAYRGVRQRVGAGMLFCPGPGDSFEIPRAVAPGSFRVLMIETETLREGLAEHRSSPEALRFRRVVSAVPPALSAALLKLLDDLSFDASTLELQSSWEELKMAIATHLSGAPGETVDAPVTSLAQRVREMIHADVEGKVDLDAFSRETGLSRFQVGRAFKRAYGLPPYAYQLCVRIAQAQRLLSQGHAPADVASELRFADQSHLIRHFKRLLNVTPSAYARAGLGTPPINEGAAGTGASAGRGHRSLESRELAR